jgi:hypothetical protein
MDMLGGRGGGCQTQSCKAQQLCAAAQLGIRYLVYSLVYWKILDFQLGLLEN